MNDLATQAKIEAAKAFDEAYSVTVHANDKGYLMNAEERAFLRKQITAHPGWQAYRQQWAIDAASLDKRRVLHFCETHDFDWRDALARHKEAEDAEAARMEAEHTANGRAAQEAGRLAGEAQRAEQAKRDAAERDATAADFAARKAEDEAQRATAAAIEATVIPTAKVEKPASEPRKAPDMVFVGDLPEAAPVPNFGGDGVTQALAAVLWSPMLQALKSDMDKTIAHAIGELPKTTIEIKRHDGSKHTLPTTHHPMLPTLIRMVSARQDDGLPGA